MEFLFSEKSDEKTNISQSNILVFLQFYFTAAKDNLREILNEKTINNDEGAIKISSSLNFWLNFSLNFKDPSFVKFLLVSSDVERVKFIKQKIKEIILIIVQFLYNNLHCKESSNTLLKENYLKLFELIFKFKDTIDNIYNSDLAKEIFIMKEEKTISNDSINQNNNELKMPLFGEYKCETKKKGKYEIIKNDTPFNSINEIKENIIKPKPIYPTEEENLNDKNKINDGDNNCYNNNVISKNNNYIFHDVKEVSLDYQIITHLFDNFCYLFNFDLKSFKIIFFEKVGYAFLKYDGDFLWADNYTSSVLFENEKIEKLNLFKLMTDFSKYILHKKFKDKFFSFKDESKTFTYTIESSKDEDQNSNKKEKEKFLFDNLSNIKTLVSRASPVILGSQGNSITCILLETKFSPYRQNFDYFYFKKSL